MPLSADGILGFFNGTTRRYEAFEHVALASAVTTVSATGNVSPTPLSLSPAAGTLRYRGTPILEAGEGVSFSGKAAEANVAATRAIPTATAVPHQLPSVQPLPLSSQPASPESKGTLYLCALPEVMWNSIAAVTAASAPSQRQLAFSSEAPAFCASRNPSFALGGQESPEKTKKGGRHGTSPRNRGGGQDYYVDPRPSATTTITMDVLPEMSAFGSGEEDEVKTHTPPHQLHTAQRHVSTDKSRNALSNATARLATEDHRHRRGSLDLLLSDTTSTATPPPAQLVNALVQSPQGIDDGIRLPGAAGPVRLQPSSSVFRYEEALPQVSTVFTPQPSVYGERQPASAGTSVTALAVEKDVPTVGPGDVAGTGTVMVLLWIATEASTAAASAGAREEDVVAAAAAGPTRSSPSTSPRSNDAHGIQLLAGKGHTNSHGSTAANGEAPLPACLCFSVKDIARAESGDTDLLTTRERRVQRFTVALHAGAPVYTAKSTSDIFEDTTVMPGNTSLPSANGSYSGSAALQAHTRGTSPRLSSSGLEHAFSFVFYQGGISRCVASLKKYAPMLVYQYVQTRYNVNASSNNSSGFLLASDGGSPRSTTGYVSPSTMSRHPSTQLGTAEVYTTASQGTTTTTSPQLLWRAGEGAPLEAGKGSSTSSGGGWPGYDASPSSQKDAQPEQQQQQQRKEIANTGGGGGWRNRLSAAGLFRHGKHNAPPTPEQTRSPLHVAASPVSASPTTAQAKKAGETMSGKKAVDNTTNSSNSSFEDLTDEMTAVRLGACYVPPKPSLPPVNAAELTSLPGAAEWSAVFDRTSPSSGVDGGSAGRKLNAARWRDFRQQLFERGGLGDPSIRFEVWCYLLNAYPVGSTEAEQQQLLQQEEELYARLTNQWKSFLPEQEEHFTVYRYAKHSIVKDVERTDRTHPAFRDDDSDMLRILRELLLAHVMLNMDLGYSQGMSDVAAIASLVAPSPSAEPAMFLCLRKMLSEHMANNFVIEERKKDAPYSAVKGLQRKLYQVQVLTRHFHPRLYGHLKLRCMAEDMTFCFRWLLVCFKRDLGSLADTMRFWDVLFACPYTKSYEVIVTVALLVALAPQIITHIHAYETLLQFMNVLSSGTTVDQILQCAREFYENVCVIETRELRRQHRNAMAYAAAVKRQEASTELYGGPYPRPVPAPPATAGSGGTAVDVNDKDHFPTVEEMVLLFLETDGPL